MANPDPPGRPRRRSRSPARAPALPIDPGSQDLAGPPPHDDRRTGGGGGGGGGDDVVEISRSPSSPQVERGSGGETPDFCLGPRGERFATFHPVPEVLAEHLERFVRFRGAARFIADHGIDLVHHAMDELGTVGDLKNPAGFLRWLVTHLQQEPHDTDR